MIEKQRCPHCHKTTPSFNRGQEKEIIESAIGKKLAIFETHYTCLECKKNFKISKTYSLNYEFTKTAFEEDK